MNPNKKSCFFGCKFLCSCALTHASLIQHNVIKAGFAFLFAFGGTLASAQPSVTWQTPVTISATSDVNTSGIYFGSWAPQDANANHFPVNGLTFQGFSDLPGLTPGPTLDNGYDGFGSP